MESWLQRLRELQYRHPLLAPVLVLVGLAVAYGSWSAHGDLQGKVTSAEAEVARLQAEQTALVQQLAAADVSANVFRNAQSALRKTVNEQAATIIDINRQLDFYRLLMEGSDSRNGLDLTSGLVITLEDVKNGYHFRFTFVQYAKTRRVLRADLSITLQGLQAGMPKSYPLETLMDSADSTKKLRFKYFQSIQGQIVLPADFEPQQFVIDARLESQKAKPWQRIVQWQPEE